GRRGLLLGHASRPLGLPGGDIERLLVVVHGALRDSDRYLANAQAAAGDLGHSTLIVAPQFLADVDLAGRTSGPDGTLHWQGGGGGRPGWGPEPISSFAAMDCLLRQLAQPREPPGGVAPMVVIFGNSAGGQYVNRYAAVGRAPDALAERGIKVRFIIANPSTYLSFHPAPPLAV